MNKSDIIVSPPWLRILQIFIGSTAIILSILVLILPRLGGFTAIVMVAITLLIVGIERIASGISPTYSKRSRLINIGLGAVILAFGIITIASPSSSLRFMVVLVGIALLINGIVRIVDALVKKKNEERKGNKTLRLAAGVVSIAVAILTLVMPTFGVILVALVVAIALIISGVEIIIVGIRGKSKRLFGK
jgi:hypothetical protein